MMYHEGNIRVPVSPSPWTMDEFDDNMSGCRGIYDGEGNDIMCTNGIGNDATDEANARFVVGARQALEEFMIAYAEGRLTVHDVNVKCIELLGVE